jgi:hypothetical protein
MQDSCAKNAVSSMTRPVSLFHPRDCSFQKRRVFILGHALAHTARERWVMGNGAWMEKGAWKKMRGKYINNA